MRVCDKENLDIVLTVHDEIVLECADEDVEHATKRLIEIMCTPPDWAEGIPLGVETNIMKRYGK
jgi:DNA polymerase